MRRVRLIRIQRLLRIEFGVQRDIRRLLGAREIDADVEAAQAWDEWTQRFEPLLDFQRVVALGLAGGCLVQAPEDDVDDHGSILTSLIRFSLCEDSRIPGKGCSLPVRCAGAPWRGGDFSRGSR